jgi:acetyltransferase
MSATTLPTRADDPERIRIDSGRWVSIRPIERIDASGLADFYARLSPASCRQRFMCASPSPSPASIARLTAADGIVAVLGEAGPNDGAIVGHASIHPDGSGAAEVAFAVADELQGRGLGTRLVAATVARARQSHLRRLSVVLYADNGRMRRAFRTIGLPILTDEIDAGTEEIAVDLTSR